MITEFERLIAHATCSLCDSDPVVGEGHQSKFRRLELLQLLWLRNGFFAYGRALHIFPSGSCPDVVTLEAWNSAEWRLEYGIFAENRLFFAEDVFGGQFCLYENCVHRFDPETGESEWVSETIPGWAAAVGSDHRYFTGWPLLKEWESVHGPLSEGHRLVPKIPFVLGGAYDVGNLFSLAAARAMRFYADLARQIRTLPEGAQVRFQVID
jgi:hypothetical protein